LIGNQQGENMADDDAVIGAEPVEESIGDFIGEQFDVAEASDIESSPVEEIRDRAEESAPQDEAVDTSTETDDGNAEPESQITTAPQSMSAKDREAYYALTPESQKWVSDRDREQQADYTKKTMEVAEQRRYFEDIEKVTGPRREQFALSGMNVAQGIDQLLSLSDFAQRDPLGFSRYLLESRGYSLADVANQQAGGQAPSDPQIVDLQQRLAAQENYISRQNDQQIQQEGRVVTGVINDFASAHPFYEELHDDMVPIVVSLKESKPGLSSDQYLDLAYKMAAAANDNVSSKMDIDREAKANVDRVAKAKQTAANARRAGGTNIQSTGTLPPNVVHSNNVDDFIGALVDERISA
jgi:hypothetical protein